MSSRSTLWQGDCSSSRRPGKVIKHQLGVQHVYPSFPPFCGKVGTNPRDESRGRTSESTVRDSILRKVASLVHPHQHLRRWWVTDAPFPDGAPLPRTRRTRCRRREENTESDIDSRCASMTSSLVFRARAAVGSSGVVVLGCACSAPRPRCPASRGTHAARVTSLHRPCSPLARAYPPRHTSTRRHVGAWKIVSDRPASRLFSRAFLSQLTPATEDPAIAELAASAVEPVEIR
jgi:hypothetical protein